MIADHDHVGEEFDWVAIDAVEEVALFSTAGRGPVPETALRHSEFFEQVFDKLRDWPNVSEAQPTSSFTHDISDWIAVAQKGIYAYDWRGTTYQLIARPSRALKIAQVRDPEFAAAARSTRVVIRFGELRSVSVEPDVVVL